MSDRGTESVSMLLLFPGILGPVLRDYGRLLVILPVFFPRPMALSKTILEVSVTLKSSKPSSHVPSEIWVT